MIWYLKLEYKSKIQAQSKKKIKNFSKGQKLTILTMIILGILLMISILIKYEYYWIIFLAYFLFIFIANHLSEKNYIKNIDEKILGYNKKINIMRSILKNENYKLYSEFKIRELIRQIEIEIGDDKKKFNKELTTLLLFPLVLQLTEQVFSNEINVEKISILTASALIIGVIYGIGIMIKPIVDELKDADKILYIKLKALLEDLLIVDFIK